MSLIYSELIKGADSELFQNEVRLICKSLGWTDPQAPNWLMIVFKAESNFIFPNVNKIGAVGYIQIIPSTAKALGTTTQNLAKLTPLQYLVWVRKYFEQSNIKKLGQPRNVYDVYFMVHYPVATGKSDSYVLYRKGSAAYTYNSGLDVDKDGLVTVANVKKWFDRFIPSNYDVSPKTDSLFQKAADYSGYLIATAIFGAGTYWMLKMGGKIVIKNLISKIF
jgi:hypothetical protein